MKKNILFWIIIIGLAVGSFYFMSYSKDLLEIVESIHITDQNNKRIAIQDSEVFEVYYKGNILKSFKKKEDAINYGRKYKYIYVKQKDKDQWIWNNFEPFILYENNKFINDYDSFSDAVFFAKEKKESKIFFLSNENMIWSNSKDLKEQVLLDVPVILQKPELPRGCEVTSLTMLLRYAGVEVDKMELAKKIKKDTTPFQKKENRIYYGNPNDGFVGDMYSLTNPGYGVYNGPIVELMEEYMPKQTINLTGSEFEDLFHFLSKGIPVWAINNTTYKKLNESQFDIWMTPTGPVEITYKLHAVVITGYDEKYIYFNDPFYSQKNIKVDRKDFKESWNQMGRQAVSYIKKID